MAFLNEMLLGFNDIFRAPFKSVEAVWILIPLFIMWIALEIYFAKYKTEKLGWNTALANGITLGWLTLEGMRSLFEAKPDAFWFRFTANVVILSYASLIMYSSFTHKISEKWNFVLASPTPVYFLGVTSVLWGFGTLKMTRFILLDLLILFIVLSLLLLIFRKMVKPAEGDLNPPEGGMPEPGLPDFAKDTGFPPLGDEGNFPSFK